MSILNCQCGVMWRYTIKSREAFRFICILRDFRIYYRPIIFRDRSTSCVHVIYSSVSFIIFVRWSRLPFLSYLEFEPYPKNTSFASGSGSIRNACFLCLLLVFGSTLLGSLRTFYFKWCPLLPPTRVAPLFAASDEFRRRATTSFRHIFSEKSVRSRRNHPIG